MYQLGFFYLIGGVLANVQSFNYTYNTTAGLGNPWIGLVPYAPDIIHTPFPHSMENFYYPMAKLMKDWNTYTFKDFEEKFNDIASRGRQAICRIYLDYPGKTLKKTDGVPAFLVPGLRFYSYDKGVSPDWENTTLQSAMKQLITHLGSVYDGDCRIAFWQVGFLGKWGEWHDEGGVPFASTKVQHDILIAFNTSFKQTALLVRYPDRIGSLSANSIRIGFHDDSFAQDTLPGPSWHFMTRMATAKAIDRWQTVPIGGELRPELQKCIFASNITKACESSGLVPEDFETCVQQSHSSWQWDNYIKEGYSPDDNTRALAAAASMGYRLYLSSVTVIRKSSTFTVSVKLQNRGVAPPYYPLRLQLTYPCDGSRPTKNITFGNDLRGLLPSSSFTTFSSGDVDIIAGSSDIWLTLVTPHAFRPILFSINGMNSDGKVKFKL